GGNRFVVLRQFYFRRFLRILPIYYLVIFIAFITNLGETRGIIQYLLTYTLNYHMASRGWFDAHFAHWWSLNVEEHFYLVWPVLFLFAPRRLVVVLTMAAVCFSPWYRIHVYGTEGGIAGFILTPSSLDFLGMGALLAFARKQYGSEGFF